MKISKLLAALAVAAAVAGFASCSNSSDTPVVPSIVSGPSVRITGSNVIAANATTVDHEKKKTTLYAFPSNFGSDTIKFTWSVVEGKEHVEDLSDVYADHVQVTAKNGDTSVDSADQTFKVKVLVQSTTTESKKAEATYTVTILKKATAVEGRVPLKFIEWKPDSSYVVVNGDTPSARTYKPKTPVEPEVKKPGEYVGFDVPAPIYNGYSLYLESGIAYKKNWKYTTSDITVAAIAVGGNSAAAPESEATWTDPDGTVGANALIVNKTDRESVTLTLAGNYNLSDDVNPPFTTTVTLKVAKGKKITVKLNANGADSFTYKGVDKKDTGIALDDVYAGVDYVTDAITGTAGAKATGLNNNSASALATTAKADTDGKVTFRVKYNAADNSEFGVKWD